MTTKRREFLLGVAAAGLAGPLRAAFQADPATDDLDALFEADAEETPPGFEEPAPVARWSTLASRPQPAWPERSRSVDYRHIVEQAPVQSTGAFRITSAVLHKLAALNSFDVGRSRERILFGLRGCSPAGRTPEGFVPWVHLVETAPDHLHSRCVIGVWRPDQDDLWLAGASTVPNVEYMYQMVQGGLPCNLLPTGLHRYEVGTHRAGSRYPQSGAFRQLDPVPVLRNRNNLIFELPPVDRYDTSINLIVADNIHAGILENAAHPPFFSSAGCQVIPGGYLRNATRAPYGRWAAFRERAGLGPAAPLARASGATPDDGRIFLYMLLTGAEARLAADETSPPMAPTIRFGSSGEHVRELRRSLGIAAPANRMDQQTMLAALKWQLAHVGYADGIIDAATATAMLSPSTAADA